MNRRPNAAEAVAALSDLLDGVCKLQLQAEASRTATVTAHASARLIVPVLGRTAAGAPSFLSNDASFRNILDDVIGSRRPSHSTSMLLDRAELESSGPSGSSATLLQFRRPSRIGDVSVCEFLELFAPPGKHGRAFALRVDGDSMAPMFDHGDLVVVSPDQPPRNAKPAVVQLRGHVGVTCKLFRRTGRSVRLIPINESFPVTRHEADDVVWALAVLYRVRVRLAGD